MKPSAKDVTQMLADSSRGDEQALATLVPLVYDELRRLARRYLRRERSEHTLQATALVHEAFLRLVQVKEVSWQGRTHFIGIAAEAMRRILVEHARRRQAAKRGGLDHKLSLNDAVDWSTERTIDLMVLDDALTRLSAMDPQKGRIVELRFFGGLTTEETAAVLGISHATVERAWHIAKLWLRRELGQGDRHDA